ncbi:MAG: M48 family metallopeptidase [Myxococcota bacterium]|nr:M48 family metalloprotease [Myxococcales bacterium]
MQLVYPKEKALFAIVVAVSALVWTALVVGTLGIALVYAPFVLVGYLFAQSGFISYVRGTGVEVSPAQLPDLHDRLERCCAELGMERVPVAYVLNAHGLLNALATRFLRRHYVVLFSDVLEALTDRPDALDFYIGHELGHIRRGHLAWAWFLAPGRILPLIGTAYSRAREYTCDLHGLACCADPEDAAYGLAVLAAGRHGSNALDLDAFADQSDATGGFWMSFHELTGDYPWLTKRMRHLRAAATRHAPSFPRRHPLAWLMAAFVPRMGGAAGGAAGAMMSVAIVGVVAAIAMPNYLRFRAASELAPAAEMRREVERAAGAFILERGHVPASLPDMGLPADAANAAVESVRIEGATIVMELRTIENAGGRTVVLTPYMDGDRIGWECETDVADAFAGAICSDAPPAAPSPGLAEMLGALAGGAAEPGGDDAGGDDPTWFVGREEYACGAFKETDGFEALEPSSRQRLLQHCAEWKLENL